MYASSLCNLEWQQRVNVVEDTDVDGDDDDVDEIESPNNDADEMESPNIK